MNLNDCLAITTKPIECLNSSLIKYNTWSQKHSFNSTYFLCHTIMLAMPILDMMQLMLSVKKSKPKDVITNFISINGELAWLWLIADIISRTQSNRQHIVPSEQYQNWQQKIFPLITSSIIFFSTLVTLWIIINPKQQELMKADNTDNFIDRVFFVTGSISSVPIYTYLLAKAISQPKFRREINLPQLQNNLIDNNNNNNNNQAPINNAPAITIIDSNNPDEDIINQNCSICLGPLNKRSDLNDSPRSEEIEDGEMEDESESKAEDNRNDKINGESGRSSENNAVISDGDIHVTLTIDSDEPKNINNDIQPGHQIAKLECNHKFHLPCLEMWAQKNDNNASCPECREPFSMQLA